jgi:sulfite exporter TauE/SafE
MAGNEILIVTAASIGFLHTLLGPDHYLPFIVLARARSWSLWRTSWITFLCGLGHIAGSVALGLAGIALGIAVTHLEYIESFRGDLAAWGLMAFGAAYMAWGIRRAVRNRPHTHIHTHEGELQHEHLHTHHHGHLHVHDEEGKRPLTPWLLFVIFVFGPCEPLIPLLMYPASQESMAGVASVAIVFGVVTVATMMAIVLAATFGFSFVPMKKAERYAHAFAGATILMCGLAIRFLGV